MPRGYVNSYLGLEKDGAKVVAQNPSATKFQIRCKCSRLFVKDREYVRKSRTPAHYLQCYECSCRAKAIAAQHASCVRTRFKGQFAPKEACHASVGL